MRRQGGGALGRSAPSRGEELQEDVPQQSAEEAGFPAALGGGVKGGRRGRRGRRRRRRRRRRPTAAPRFEEERDLPRRHVPDVRRSAAPSGDDDDVLGADGLEGEVRAENREKRRQ